MRRVWCAAPGATPTVRPAPRRPCVEAAWAGIPTRSAPGRDGATRGGTGLGPSSFRPLDRRPPGAAGGFGTHAIRGVAQPGAIVAVGGHARREPVVRAHKAHRSDRLEVTLLQRRRQSGCGPCTPQCRGPRERAVGPRAGAKSGRRWRNQTEPGCGGTGPPAGVCRRLLQAYAARGAGAGETSLYFFPSPRPRGGGWSCCRADDHRGVAASSARRCAVRPAGAGYAPQAGRRRAALGLQRPSGTASRGRGALAGA